MSFRWVVVVFGEGAVEGPVEKVSVPVSSLKDWPW